MALSTTAQDELSTFFKNFPTGLHYIQPKSCNRLRVFWSGDEEGSETNYAADIHPPTLQDQIKSAFSNLEYSQRQLIVQLWAPVTINGRCLLSTSAQPFALSSLDKDELKKYRLRSMEYHYNIDVNNRQLHFQQQQEENLMILSGGPAAAFLNGMPEFAHLKDHQRSPLARYALEECGFRHSFMLPICHPSQTSSCIGVVECTFYNPYYLIIMKRMKHLLEEGGLSICPVQERIPYKTINALKPARDDIEAALKIVCESHNFFLAQVWIAYEDENHEPFSSSMEDTQTKHMIALKLTGYLKIDAILIDCGAEDYYNICDVVHLEAGKELVANTLKDYKSRFCKGINNVGHHELFAYVSNKYIQSTGITICLRSIDTGELDYVFEFIWYRTSNYVIMLEALLLTLKRCLPHFKFASGAELGDELKFYVIDDPLHNDVELGDELVLHNNAENITETEIKSFTIFQGKISSPSPIALEAGKKPIVVDSYEAKWKTAPKQLSQQNIEKQFGNTMKEAAENLNVSLSTLKRKCKGFGIKEWQGRPDVVKKRKVNPSSNNQNNRNEEDHGAIQEPSIVNRMEDTLTIKAKYKDDMIKFKLNISQATFVNVEKEIGVNFNLTLETFKLKYCDEDGDWILLRSDQNMRDCLESLRISGRPTIQLLVIQSTK